MTAAHLEGLGPLVLELRLPLELAPTLNVYAQAEGWRKKKLAERIDWIIVAAKQKHPAWRMGVVREPRDARTHRPGKATGGRRRAVVVTRESSVRPDELAVDAIGGKLVVDRLVHANVLRNDDHEWCERVARWVKAPPRIGGLVVQVHEIGGVA